MSDYDWAVYVPGENVPRDLGTGHPLLAGQLLVLDGIEYRIDRVEEPDELLPDRPRVYLSRN